MRELDNQNPSVNGGSIKIIDLYCGIGGASKGFKDTGYEPAFACDSDPEARLVYASNFSTDVGGDVDDLVAKNLIHPQMIFASPPDKDVSSVIRLLNEIQPRVMILEFPLRLIAREVISKHSSFELAGYKCWHDVLNANDFGLPIKREMLYIVGFRNDVKTLFSSFPFPDATCKDATLANILEQNPDEKLLVSKERLLSIKKRNELNAEQGTGFKTQVYLPEHVTPSLPISYWKDYRHVLVDSGQGPRRLSVLECKRLMGFPDDFKLPVCNMSAYRLLAQASCPPVIAELAREISVWI